LARRRQAVFADHVADYLHDRGVITDAEFEKAKETILS
jgi:hypothetical protein